MDDIFTLLIFAAMIWSMIGGALGKKGKQRPSPPSRPRRSGDRASESRADAWGRGDDARDDGSWAVPGRYEDEQRAAAEMIPDDLWQILTGERRSTSVPSPEPEPAWGGGFDDGTEPAPAGGVETLETFPELEEPIVVSMETPPPPPEARHEAFHRRLDAVPATRRTVRRTRVPGALGTARGLRRAVVLREILGPPKALE